MQTSQNRFLSKTDSFISAINRVDSRLLIFLLLCLNFLSFTVDSNEEAYFPLAKQFIDPQWIPGSFSFTEWVGTRFLFQTIAGHALQFLSFEQLSFFGRLVNFAFMAFPLALIFRELKIRNIGMLIILQLFISDTRYQYLVGQEWIFKGFEAKTIAYGFIFYAVYYVLKGRYGLAALFTAAASYFHILVGGWFFVLLGLYVLIKERNFKTVLLTGGVYLLVASPFVAYLAFNLNESGSVINGVDIDYISVFLRNAHHTAPLHSKGFSDVCFRIGLCLVFFLASIFYFKKSSDPLARKLNLIGAISIGMVFFGLFVEMLDTNGRLLKYYFFRISGTGAFAYMLLFALLIREKYKNVPWRVVALCLFIPLFLFQVGNNIARTINAKDTTRDVSDLADYAAANTDPDDVFLFLDKEDPSFPRRARREAFVLYKCDPGGGAKIYEWYKRVQLRDSLEQDLNNLNAITGNYQLDYIIATEPKANNRLREVYRNSKYYLYEITESK